MYQLIIEQELADGTPNTLTKDFDTLYHVGVVTMSILGAMETHQDKLKLLTIKPIKNGNNTGDNQN
jgi:hypothetical protein